jgi:hypothetical protein
MPRGRESRRPRARRCVDRLEVKIRRARGVEQEQDEGRRVESRENRPDTRRVQAGGRKRFNIEWLMERMSRRRRGERSRSDMRMVQPGSAYNMYMSL